MLKIAHVADLHFGRRMTTQTASGENLRELDIYKAGDLVANYIAHTLQPDLVVVAGDVWDTPNPSPKAIRHGFDFHQVLRSADIPVVVIGGNHDTLTSIHKATLLSHLNRYFDCKVVLQQEAFEMLGLRFECIPYRALSTHQLNAAPDWSKEVPNIMIGHANVNTPKMPDFSKYDDTVLPKSLFDPEYVALGLLGHIHIHGEIAPNTFYAGAIERLTWKEIDNDPAIFVHSIADNGKVSSQSIRVADMGMPLVPRPVQNLFLNCEKLLPKETLEQAEALLQQNVLSDSLVQLTLSEASREVNSLPKFEDSIQKAAKGQGAFALKLKTKLRQAPEWNYQPSGPAPGATLADTYLEWAKKNGFADVAQIGAEFIGGNK